MKTRIAVCTFLFLFIIAQTKASTTCSGDGSNSTVVAEYGFGEGSGTITYNSGTDGTGGNAGLTNGVTFSTNVPPTATSCGWSVNLPNTGTGTTTPAVETSTSYDPLAGVTNFTIMAWVKRASTSTSSNTAARIVSDVNSLGSSANGFEFRFQGTSGLLTLNINGTERNTSVGGIAPTSNFWHHVAVVYDGRRPATNTLSRNVHFYVDGIQRGDGNTLTNFVVGANSNRMTVGNASVSRGILQTFVGKIDGVRILRGFSPDPVGDGKTNDVLRCYRSNNDDVGDSDGDGLTDCEEVNVYHTDPHNSDTDGDGMPDGWEVSHGLNPLSNADASADPDDDGLTNLQEYQHGTDPHLRDSDSDWLSDGDEVNIYGTDPANRDTDGDGYDDGDEVLVYGSDPLTADVDNDEDGIPDWWENAHGLDPNDQEDVWNDDDNDGLTNIEEFWYGTDPQNADTDGDGYSDGDEVRVYGTDPLDPDSHPSSLRSNSALTLSSSSSSSPIICASLPPGSGGGSFGSVESGKRYLTRAKGSVAFNLDGAFSDPDGNRSGTQSGQRNPAGTGFLCPSQIGYSLVGKIDGGSCLQLGKCQDFTASADGDLTLYFNDDIYGDNSGAWDVCVIPDRFRITVMTFIPEPYVSTPFSCEIGKTKTPYFAGDDRPFAEATSGGVDGVVASGSYRTLQAVTVNTQPGEEPGSYAAQDGLSVGYASDAVVSGTLLPAAIADTALDDCHYKHSQATGTPNTSHSVKVKNGVIKVQMKGNGKNPLVTSCAIDWKYQITIDVSCGTFHPKWFLDYKHDRFPNHEVYINDQAIHEFDHGFNFILLCAPSMFPFQTSSSDNGELQ